MKKIFTSRNLTDADMVRSLLDSNGIDCLMKNEHGAHTAAAGIGFAMPFAWPEIWVGDDDFERATEIIAQFKTDHQGTLEKE